MVLLELSRLSLYTQYEQACSAPDTVVSDDQTSPKQPRSNRDLKYLKYYTLQVTTACRRRSSSTLLHDELRSGTEKAMDSVDRRARNCRMVHHPRTGWSLLMTGADRLDGGMPAVSQNTGC